MFDLRGFEAARNANFQLESVYLNFLHFLDEALREEQNEKNARRSNSAYQDFLRSY